MDETWMGAGSADIRDYQQYDRIWQRIAPDLDPYPEIRREREEHPEQLPGSVEDPCCMGTAAGEMLEVISGFIEDELAGKRFFRRFSGNVSGTRAVRLLQQIAGNKACREKKLMAAYYLISGVCYRGALQVPQPEERGYCRTLRRAYHEEACAGLNYWRAADGTGDPCLQKLFRQMGEEAQANARSLLGLLSRSMQ